MSDHPRSAGEAGLNAVVFDLDGTLVDSAPAIAAAVNQIMASRGLPSYEVDEVAAFIGDGPDMVLRRALGGRGVPMTEDASQRFAEDYAERAVAESELFPDVCAALEELRFRGYRLAVCTNKPATATGRLLRRLDIDWMFGAVCCSDECAHRKPHPSHLLETLRRLQPAIRGAVMIGDHRNDMLAASACHLPSILAEWDPTLPKATGSMTGCEVTYRTKQPLDLPAILERIFAEAAAFAPDHEKTAAGCLDFPGGSGARGGSDA